MAPVNIPIDGNMVDIPDEDITDADKYPQWMCESLILIGEKVIYSSPNGHVGYFLGFSMDDEDYYYRMEVSGVIKYYSCVGKIELV